MSRTVQQLSNAKERKIFSSSRPSSYLYNMPYCSMYRNVFNILLTICIESKRYAFYIQWYKTFLNKIQKFKEKNNEKSKYKMFFIIFFCKLLYYQAGSWCADN